MHTCINSLAKKSKNKPKGNHYINKIALSFYACIIIPVHYIYILSTNKKRTPNQANIRQTYYPPVSKNTY